MTTAMAPTQKESTTILVIDDREPNRLLIQRLFEPLDYRVIEAASGPAGLALAEAERPACILLDLDMPGMSGFEVLERLQDDPRTRGIPVVILTATDDNLKNLDRAMQAGAVDYLTKPISTLRLAIRVRGAIERRRLLTELQDLRAGFTSMLVHDLRSPLTVIQGYAQLLGPGSPNEKHRKGLHEIQGACDRMLRLISEILDLSKLEAGRLALEPRPVDLVTLIADVVDRLQPVAAPKEIRLEFPSRPMEPVMADARRIEQVLMNLLNNALKFTPSGGTITVEAADCDDGLEVTVTDTGPGIAAKEVPLLFEPFRQASTGRNTPGGTGLGLVVCRHLVEAHGGQIWAKSTVGVGSRFTFRLPRTARPPDTSSLCSPSRGVLARS